MSFTSLLITTPALIALFSCPVLQAADEKAGGPDAKAMELMKPGPEHQHLAKLVGTWDVACKMWMQLDAPPVESKGSETFTTLFEGRFLQAKFEGSMMGQPFVGHATMGYNRSAKRYVTTWHDSMSTGIMYLSGTSNDAGKTITYVGEATCPGEDTASAVRQVQTHTSADSFTLVMYMTKSGKETKTMELTYTRRR